MEREPYELPEGVTMPKRFDKAYKKQMGFIKGVWNAIEGRPMADERSVTRQIGPGAWEGYKVGYESGKGYKSKAGVGSSVNNSNRLDK